MNRRSEVLDGPGIKWDPISKITRAKGAEGMAPAEHLPSKCKALSSNSSTMEEKKKMFSNWQDWKIIGQITFEFDTEMAIIYIK
jgi:hypothetical protein